MPKGFPFSGMENPNLLFATNPIISGDKTLVRDIGNYVMHFWTGNLVTILNWENLWLSEGLSTFVERKLIKKSLGEEMFNLTAYSGLRRLNNYISLYGENYFLTSLHPNLNKLNPDIAFNVVPKEKGFLLLCYLEVIIKLTIECNWRRKLYIFSEELYT